MAFSLIFSIRFGLSDQQQIFRQLHLIGLLEILTGLVLLALDISKILDRVWQAGLLHQLNFYEILGSSLVSNIWPWVVLDGKSSQGYSVNAGVPQGSIPVPTLFLLYIKDLPDDVILNIAIYADNTILCSKCDQASDLWQQLELASELESNQ